jgi:serine/threonine protein kinase
MLKNYKLRDSIISEIIVLRKLVHENIISLEEVHEDSTSVYMIYPIYRGGELFELFKMRKQSKVTFSEIEGKIFLIFNSVG